ncbi:hypothetical protein GCM10027046_26530 [Uliginosibacterium flavum]|uniref:HAD domain-containing protein n=1 Tax=Uliginosibacterium flavum TaxID=1396831 RepID=A0ABV2TJZ1_9RHOO
MSTITHIFIDFDGTLHTADVRTRDLFCWLPLLVKILEPYTAVRIIVSSDWRTRCSDEQLIQILGPLGSRFAGITETYGSDRAQEIRDDVRARKITRWLALDDHETVQIAAKSNPRFVWCPPDQGISCPVVQAKLKGLLAS